MGGEDDEQRVRPLRWRFVSFRCMECRRRLEHHGEETRLPLDMAFSTKRPPRPKAASAFAGLYSHNG